MPSKISRHGDYLIDPNGSPIERFKTDENKQFAVILKCGHCGVGYFIPIMFTTASRDIHSAINSAKLLGRVQRDRSDCVLAAFEITRHQRQLIETINDHDPYLRSMIGKDHDQIIERRVMHEIKASRDPGKAERSWAQVKTAEDYKPYYVLERCFAPHYVNGKWVTPSRVNKDELLKEFFTQNCIRFGVSKGQAYLPILYYQEYGKDNPLGLTYENGYLHFVAEDKKRTVPVYGQHEKIMNEFIRQEKKELARKKKEEEELASRKTGFAGAGQTPSRIDRFNARFNKTMQLQKQDESESGGIQPEA